MVLKYPILLFTAIALCFLQFPFAVTGVAVATEPQTKVETASAGSLSIEELEMKWGVRPLSIRQTADGHMLDFRYRITDAEKASPLFSPKIKPIVIDEDTGAVMAVPTVPKVGSMRSTRKPLQDRNYAILFANPQKHIKPGHKVTVVIGDYRAEHLVVE